MKAFHVIEELENIYFNQPLFPGDTISHSSANACIELGWAKRNTKGNFIITEEGSILINKIYYAIDEVK